MSGRRGPIEHEVVGETADGHPFPAAAYRLDHLRSQIARKQREHGTGVELVARLPCLGFVEVEKLLDRHLAALQPSPGIVVGIARVELADQPRRKPVCAFERGKGLKGARGDHAAKVEQDGGDRRLGACLDHLRGV